MDTLIVVGRTCVRIHPDISSTPVLDVARQSLH